jgi:hypothetical protein
VNYQLVANCRTLYRSRPEFATLSSIPATVTFLQPPACQPKIPACSSIQSRSPPRC